MTFHQTKLFILGRLLAKLDQYAFALYSAPIVARTRTLSARWTLEEEQEMEVWVEPSAEKLLKKVLDARKRMFNARIRAAKKRKARAR